MRVRGDAFFLINGWMNFLSLLLTSRMLKKRFRLGKTMVSAFLGAVYGITAWMGNPFFRSVPALLLSAFLMAMMVFGRSATAATPLIFASGWLLSGLSDFARKRGAAAWAVLLLCGGTVLLICLAIPACSRKKGGMRLEIWLNRKRAVISAFADNGNLLKDEKGLPVIIVPEKEIKALLPEGVHIRDLSTLPAGWRLIGIRTAAGRRTLMCFQPEKLILHQGKKKQKIAAAVAVSDFEENRALLPGCLCADE